MGSPSRPATFSYTIGAVPAVLPALIDAWRLSNTQAGWLTGIYDVGYTLAVPVLSSLTDRIDPRRVSVLSSAVTAIAFAGYAAVADATERRPPAGGTNAPPKMMPPAD